MSDDSDGLPINGSDFLENLCRRHGAVAVSALRREGLERLVEAADRLLFGGETEKRERERLGVP